MPQAATALHDSGVDTRSQVENSMAMTSARDPGACPQSLIAGPDFLRGLIQPILKSEMSAHLGAERFERERHVAAGGAARSSEPRSQPRRRFAYSDRGLQPRLFGRPGNIPYDI